MKNKLLTYAIHFVKVRPIGYRGQPTIACDPWA